MNLIKELRDGDRGLLQALVGSVSKGVNANGGQYLNVELRDSSGSINGKKWEIDDKDEEIFVVGNIVSLSVEVLKYRDNLQLKILGANKIPDEQVDIYRFIKLPPVPQEELRKRFDKMLASIKDEDCKAILNYFLDKYGNKVYEAPAATSVHHEFASGLLMHSLYMAEIADFLSTKYDVDRDLLITGAIIHDFGKMVELEGPAVFHYTLEGKLLGHISIMCADIRKAAEELHITSETPILLEHMILSHHGKHEFGSPVLPLTKEALLLSIIDLLDSKMMIVSKALEETKEGEFTQKIFHIDNCSFYKPKKK